MWLSYSGKAWNKNSVSRNLGDEKNVRDYQTKNLLRDRDKSKNYEAFIKAS